MNITSCSQLLENGYYCGKTFNLHEIYFRDPTDHRNSIFIKLCRFHYDGLMKELNEELTTMKRKLDNTIFEDKRQRKIAKENDVIYQMGTLQYQIETLKEKYKKMALNQCRNFFCNQDLTKLGMDQKLYSVTTFKPSGRRHNTFYLCSYKCFNIIKGKAGIQTLAHKTGQQQFPI